MSGPQSPADPPKRRRGRPRKPNVYRLESGRQGARVTIDVDGETVRKRFRFETTDAAVARVKVKRVLSAPPSEAVAVATSDETVADAFTRANRARAGRGVVRPDIELGRMQKHALGVILDRDGDADPLHTLSVDAQATEVEAARARRALFGQRAITAVTADDVTEVLAEAQRRGQSEGSVGHLRKTLKLHFDELVNDKACPLKVNPVIAAVSPGFRKTVKKEYGVFDDAETLTYMRWQHPVERHRHAVVMRQAMSAVSRCFGGHRTNCLHTSTWEDFEIDDDGVFVRGWVPRTKTKQPQRMNVPHVLQPVLAAYWEMQGRPTEGPLFPILRGERAGQARTEGSHADAMRRDVRRALGIDVWDTERRRWVNDARKMTPRERELFVPARYTEPVNFHSWRRAWSQGLERVGVDIVLGGALTGQTAAMQAHYRQNSRRAKSIPAESLPDLTGGIFGQGLDNNPKGVGLTESDYPEVSATSLRARKDSNLRPLASEADGDRENSAIRDERAEARVAAFDENPPGSTERGQKCRPISAGPDLTLSENVLADLFDLATKARRWDLTQALSGQLEAVTAAKADTKVASLDQARRRRERGTS